MGNLFDVIDEALDSFNSTKQCYWNSLPKDDEPHFCWTHSPMDRPCGATWRYVQEHQNQPCLDEEWGKICTFSTKGADLYEINPGCFDGVTDGVGPRLKLDCRYGQVGDCTAEEHRYACALMIGPDQSPSVALWECGDHVRGGMGVDKNTYIGCCDQSARCVGQYDKDAQFYGFCKK